MIVNKFKNLFKITSQFHVYTINVYTNNLKSVYAVGR